MSLHGKFRVLLAVFGLSIFANVLVSVWCIHIYVAEATGRFQVLMYRTRDTEDIRRLLDGLVEELRDRAARASNIQDRRYRNLLENLVRRIDELAAGSGEPDVEGRGVRLTRLGADLADACERYVGMLNEGRQVDAQALLAGEITSEILDPLHLVLADCASDLDRALTRTSAEIDTKQATVTVILSVNAAIAFLLAAVGVHLLRNWVLKPVDALKSAVEIHARGELSHRVPAPSSDELGTLARAVNRSAASLMEYQRRLVEQERLAAIGEVASSVAHNIRNPLASLRAAAQAALPDMDRSDPNRIRLEEMIATVDSLSRWLRELLMVSRPIDLQRSPVAVAEIIDRVLTVMRPAARRRGTEIRVEVNGDCVANVDASRMEQALLAVVDNAVEASPQDGRVSIAARRAEQAGWIELSVTDNGPGIDADVAANVTRPFFSTKPGGTGIGLHLCTRIVQAHGGALAFQNPESGGTMVTLRLPAADGDDGGA